jgi:heterodisulfide reductase subunit A-like polyferredoxin
MSVPGEELNGVYQAIDFLKEINLGHIITTPIATVDEDLCIKCGVCASECVYGAIRLKKDKKNPNKKSPIIEKYICKGCGKCATVCPSKAIKLTGIRDITPKVGKKVLVVGGGNAALDTARSAIRLGGEDVTVIYRRSRIEMPAEPEWEIDETEREGVKFKYLTSPIKIIGDKKGHVKAVKCIKMRLLDEVDKSGRRQIEPVPNSEFTIDADTIILAIGQEVDTGFLSRDVDLEYTPYSSIKVDPLSFTANHKGKLEYTPWSTIKIDRITHETSIKGVFCAGDAVWGAGTVIESIAAGKEAAISIDRYINGQDLKEGREEKLPVAQISTEGIKKKKMVPMRLLPLKERKNNFKEVELGYSEEEAIEEAGRCLNCGGCVECLECVRTCEAEAIDHNMKDEIVEVKVGSIILATGYEKYPPELKGEYGYGRYPNVINSLEFERMLSASGPYQGHVKRPSDKKEPKKIAWINCVGSRDRGCGNNYCSAVCCTYSIKEAVIAKEHLSSIEPTIFFMDMRTYGKGFEEYYQRAKDESNIRFVRCRISEINQDEKTKSLLLKYETEEGNLIEEEFDMVVLSVGLTPNENAKSLAEKLDIRLNEFGFSETPELKPIETTRKGIFVSGVFSGPKDIPETVVESSGAAAKAIDIISSERNKNVEKKTYPQEIDVTNQEPRIGVFICHCGINIGAYVDVPTVVEYAKTLDNVIYAERNLYTCSQDTQKKIVEKIKENKLNRVIVASCTPRTHEPLFQETLREAGLNPHLFEMANIRDQCSWVHMNDKKGATEKAKDLMKMAVAKARLIEPLESIKVDITQKALIIGAGLAGMTCALSIADQGFEVFLVEKENKLGGNLNHINYTLKNSDIQQYLKDLISKVEKHKKINVYKNAKIEKIDGFVGNFKTTIKNGKISLDVEHGIVVVATGAEEAKPDEYLYGKNPEVLTQMELEEKIAQKTSFKKKTVVMIQCVGSRDEKRPYCCRIGCSIAIKNALKIKKQNPDAEVYILYRDVRTYGFMETYYEQARENGIIFIRYEPEEKPIVKQGKVYLEVEIRDIILNEKILLHADNVILSSAIVPRKENEELAKQLKVPLNEDGFFLEAHVKLRPVDFSTEGIFLAGMSHFPKTIEETLSQAYAAVSRATKILSKQQLEIEPRVSSVDETKCIGCGLCVSLCPSNAIELKLKEGGRKAQVITASCKGCGICGASCPQQAITMRHFRDLEIAAQIKAYGGDK